MPGRQKEFSWYAAIVEVLRRAQSAMHYADIADEIIKQKLRTKVGATPAATVNVIITNEINTKGETAAFVRVSRGEYMLREGYIVDQSKEELAAEESEASEVPEVIDSGPIRAFGIHWNRDFVNWKGNPRLLGQQQKGAEKVDFSEQRGVYLLYDGRAVVYVGRAIDQPLGTRLYQHTFDRLSGRWDRFSWFGLLPVTPEGKVKSAGQELATLSVKVDDLVATLEALLVEALEPPQNRRRGDDFRAAEYIQVEDEILIQKRKKEVLEELLKAVRT